MKNHKLLIANFTAAAPSNTNSAPLAFGSAFFQLTSQPFTLLAAAIAGAAVVGTVVVAKKVLSKDEDEFEYTP